MLSSKLYTVKVLSPLPDFLPSLILKPATNSFKASHWNCATWVTLVYFIIVSDFKINCRRFQHEADPWILSSRLIKGIDI